MATCCICGKKVGMFEGNSLSMLEAEWKSYVMCANCSQIVKKLKEGDIETYNNRQEILENISDEKVRAYISQKIKVPEKELLEKLEREKEEQIAAVEKQKRLLEFETIQRQNTNNIKLTTGYDFKGYDIIEYKNVISGECVLGTGFLSEFTASFSDFTGTSANLFSTKLKEVKNRALYLLKQSCYLENGNAIIGVDFDYITFQNNMIGVVANGTAVVIEKQQR